MVGPMGPGVWLATLLAVQGGEVVQRIEWDGIEGCPSQAAIVEATHGYLGRSLAAFPRAVLARARVEADPMGYRLRLTITVDGTHEQHELRAVDCDRIGRDAALLIASAVDPFASGPPAPAERQLGMTPVIVQRPRTRPTVTATAATTAEPKIILEPDPPGDSSPGPSSAPPLSVALVDRPEPLERPPNRPVVGSLGAAGTGFVGLFPQIGGGVELEGGLRRGRFRWQLGAAGWFGAGFRAPGTDVGVDLWAASGSTGFCVAPHWGSGWGSVRLAACAVAGAGAITATSVNTQNQRTLVRPWAFAGPDVRVTWSPRPRFGLYLGIAALPALVRPGWSVQNPEASFRIPPVLGLLRLGVELGELHVR